MSDDEKPTTSPKKGDKKGNQAGKEEEEEIQSDDESSVERIRKFFAEKFSLVTAMGADGGTKEKVKVIEDLSFNGLAKHWKEKGFKNIITMVGAGISTSAGIPDFRSPGSGLYDNLQKYNLPHPQAIFDVSYFETNPQPFFALAKELYPGTFIPTPSHYFIRLLYDKGLLVRHYTQNIDTLDRIAGIPEEMLVEAHGTFYTNHCLGCKRAFSMEWMKAQIFSDNVPTCDKCNSIVKPDIVFFGENLPEKFYTYPLVDFAKCDLLIIMGTSLEVHPFASLVDYAEPNCVRLLINRTKVGHDSSGFSFWFNSGSKLMFDSAENTRDVAYIGDCDDGVLALAEALGWSEELKDLMKRERERLAKENATDVAALSSKKKKKSDKKSNEESGKKLDHGKLGTKEKTTASDKNAEEKNVTRDEAKL